MSSNNADVMVTYGADATALEAVGRKVEELGDVSEQRLARSFERITRDIIAARSPMDALLSTSRTLGTTLNVGLPVAAAAGVMWQFYDATKKSYEEMRKLGEETLKATRPVMEGHNYGPSASYQSRLESLRERRESVAERVRTTTAGYFDPSTDRGSGKFGMMEGFGGLFQSMFSGGEYGIFGTIAKAARDGALAEQGALASAARLLVKQYTHALQAESATAALRTRAIATGEPAYGNQADIEALARKQKSETMELNGQLQRHGILGTPAGDEARAALKENQAEERANMAAKQRAGRLKREQEIRELDQKLDDIYDEGGAASDRRLRALDRRIRNERDALERERNEGNATPEKDAKHRNAIAEAEREKRETQRSLAEDRRALEDSYADATDRGPDRNLRSTFRHIENARREEEIERARGANADPDKIRRLQIEQERGKTSLLDTYESAMRIPAMADSLTAVGGGGNVAHQSGMDELVAETSRQTTLMQEANAKAEKLYQLLSKSPSNSNAGFSAE